jgi:hypothetical protein
VEEFSTNPMIGPAQSALIACGAKVTKYIRAGEHCLSLARACQLLASFSTFSVCADLCIGSLELRAALCASPSLAFFAPPTLSAAPFWLCHATRPRIRSLALHLAALTRFLLCFVSRCR